jgi:hypothetical protein
MATLDAAVPTRRAETAILLHFRHIALRPRAGSGCNRRTSAGSAAPARADTNATNGMLFIFAAMAATTLHQNLRADPIRDVAVPGSAGAQPRNRLLPCRP